MSVGCFVLLVFFFGVVRPQSSFQIFQSFYGSGDCRGEVFFFFFGRGDGGVWVGKGGGQKWLFFTLHSDQSFLDTPELRGSRTDTRPAGRETKPGVRTTAHCKLVS